MTGDAPPTVIVVPRERLSSTLTTLQHLVAFTRPPYRCLVIDPSTGPRAQKLRAFASAHPHVELVPADGLPLPHEARDLALRQLGDGDGWLAFVDNDVRVQPGWLEHLIDAAEEAHANAAHPLTLIEEGGEVLIHMSFGQLRGEDGTSEQPWYPRMGHKHVSVDAAGELATGMSDFLEFHTFLIRRSLYDAISPLPPLTLGEHLELSLRLRERGEPIVFVPQSVVTYAVGRLVDWEDRRYFVRRWGSQRATRSVARLREAWPIQDIYWRQKLAWRRRHVLRAAPGFGWAQDIARRARPRLERVARRRE